jgi:hypothetical protein
MEPMTLAILALLVTVTIAVLVRPALQAPRLPNGTATASRPTCAECATPMEEGYLPDFAYAQVVLTRWVPGKPVQGWFGLRGFFWRSKGIPVSTYRCPTCGRLRSYAR